MKMTENEQIRLHFFKSTVDHDQWTLLRKVDLSVELIDVHHSVWQSKNVSLLRILDDERRPWKSLVQVERDTFKYRRDIE